VRKSTHPALAFGLGEPGNGTPNFETCRSPRAKNTAFSLKKYIVCPIYFPLGFVHRKGNPEGSSFSPSPVEALDHEPIKPSL
jgi:hypothetical protein